MRLSLVLAMIVTSLAVTGACAGKAPQPAAPAEPQPAAPPPAATAERPAPTADAPAKLRVTDLMPTTGASGTAVTIHGQGFTGASGQVKVYFGATQATLVRMGADEIVVEAPAGRSGAPVDVLLVFESRGEITLPGVFTFTAP